MGEKMKNSMKTSTQKQIAFEELIDELKKAR